MGKSLAVRDITVSHCHGEVLFTGVSSQICLGCVRFQAKSQSDKSSVFGLGAFLLPGSQRRCHFTRGLSGGACGNRKHCMLQPFTSCQPKTCHDRISDADFGVSPLTGYQFQCLILNVWRDCCVGYRRLTVSHRIHAKCRLRSKNWLSKFVLPKADKAEAEGCQDPRQLFFSFHGKHVNLSC